MGITVQPSVQGLCEDELREVYAQQAAGTCTLTLLESLLRELADPRYLCWWRHQRSQVISMVFSVPIGLGLLGIATHMAMAL